jgi:hypothetical protein
VTSLYNIVIKNLGAMHANYINQFSFEIFGLHQIQSGKTESVLGGPACSLVCAWSAYNFVEWTMTDGWTYLSKTLTRMMDNPNNTTDFFMLRD